MQSDVSRGRVPRVRVPGPRCSAVQPGTPSAHSARQPHGRPVGSDAVTCALHRADRGPGRTAPAGARALVDGHRPRPPPARPDRYQVAGRHVGRLVRGPRAVHQRRRRGARCEARPSDLSELGQSTEKPGTAGAAGGDEQQGPGPTVGDREVGDHLECLRRSSRGDGDRHAESRRRGRPCGPPARTSASGGSPRAACRPRPSSAVPCRRTSRRAGPPARRSPRQPPPDPRPGHARRPGRAQRRPDRPRSPAWRGSSHPAEATSTLAAGRAR